MHSILIDFEQLEVYRNQLDFVYTEIIIITIQFNFALKIELNSLAEFEIYLVEIFI